MSCLPYFHINYEVNKNLILTILILIFIKTRLMSTEQSWQRRVSFSHILVGLEKLCVGKWWDTAAVITL